MIFKNLPLHYRLKCKQVCKRWYELLMKRKIFREDRHIHLTDCLIEPGRPPMSVFMDAKLPYDILTLKIRELDKDVAENFVNSILFWRHLGQTVTEIHFNILSCSLRRHYGNLYEILFEMPEIKILVITGFLDLFVRKLEEVQEQTPDRQYLTKLETIKADACRVDCLKENMAALKRVTPEHTEIIIDFLYFDENIALTEILSMMRTIKANCFKLEFDNVRTDAPVLQALLESENLPFNRIKLDYTRTKAYPSVTPLEEFLSKHQKVNELRMDANFDIIPLPDPFIQMTELTLWGRSRNRSVLMESLEPLIHLETLIIRSTDIDCLDRHKTIDLPKLRKFSLMSIKCSECLTALAKSFPNLEEFRCIMEIPDYLRVLGLMLRNWRSLKLLKADCEKNSDRTVKTVENFENLVKKLKKPQLSLQTLDIPASQGLKYTGDDFIKMSKFFPNLNSLGINVNKDMGDVEDIVKGILPAFTELTSLCITEVEYQFGRKSFASSSLSKSKSDAILKYVLRHGHSLRVSFPPFMTLIFSLISSFSIPAFSFTNCTG